MKSFRLCVDIDRAGNVLGRSWEAIDDDGHCCRVVVAQTGPFDSIFDAVSDNHSDVLERYGLQRALFAPQPPE